MRCHSQAYPAFQHAQPYEAIIQWGFKIHAKAGQESNNFPSRRLCIPIIAHHVHFYRSALWKKWNPKMIGIFQDPIEDTFKKKDGYFQPLSVKLCPITMKFMLVGWPWIEFWMPKVCNAQLPVMTSNYIHLDFGAVCQLVDKCNMLGYMWYEGWNIPFLVGISPAPSLTIHIDCIGGWMPAPALPASMGLSTRVLRPSQRCTFCSRCLCSKETLN